MFLKNLKIPEKRKPALAPVSTTAADRAADAAFRKKAQAIAASDYERDRKAERKKADRLKALRLAKEAAEREEAAQSAVVKAAAKKPAAKTRRKPATETATI